MNYKIVGSVELSTGCERLKGFEINHIMKRKLKKYLKPNDETTHTMYMLFDSQYVYMIYHIAYPSNPIRFPECKSVRCVGGSNARGGKTTNKVI